MVFLLPFERGQDSQQCLACRVVQPVAVGDRPVHHSLYALPDPAGGLVLERPDGFKYRQNIGRCNLVDGLLTNQGKGIGFEG